MSVREEFSRYLRGHERDPELNEVDHEPASSFLREAMFDALRRFEPAASLPAFANIRLFGEHFEDGVFDVVAAEIFSQIDQELRAAAPSEIAEELSFGFRQVRTGSVVLPIVPFVGEAPREGEFEVPQPSPVEVALVKVLDLHDTLETGEIPYTRLGRAAASNELMHRLRLLVDALDKADAGVEIELSQHNGRRRVSQLSRRGRIHAHRLFEPRSSVSIDYLSGNLAGISIEDGVAKIQLRVKKRKIDIVGVPAGIAKRLPWDEYLRIQVRTVVTQRYGERKATVHEYLAIMHHEDPFPEGDYGVF